MRFSAISSVLLGVSALALAAAAPVSASPVQSTPTAFIPTQVSETKSSAGFGSTSTVWGGYAATNGNFSSVSSSWTMPAVTCNSTNDLFAPWVGIDGYGSQTVEQTGVEVSCASGSAAYHPWYEMYPANPVYYSDVTAKAGDSFTASVTRSASADNNGRYSYTLVLTNNTQGWTKTTPKSLATKNVSAEAVIEAPQGHSYPNFGTLNFKNTKVDGAALSTTNPTAIDTVSNGTTRAVTGSLSGGDFSITYKHG